jgi:hypothetical protein
VTKLLRRHSRQLRMSVLPKIGPKAEKLLRRATLAGTSVALVAGTAGCVTPADDECSPDATHSVTAGQFNVPYKSGFLARQSADIQLSIDGKSLATAEDMRFTGVFEGVWPANSVGVKAGADGVLQFTVKVDRGRSGGPLR